MKGKYKFLYLEDSTFDVEIFSATLRREGMDYELVHVTTRSEYTSAIEEQNFDLIFSDYALPAFDGMSALEMAKNKCPEVPFIIISGNIGEELAIETLKRGATDYVLKNRFDRLLPSIQRALQEKKQNDHIRQAESLKTKYDFIVNTSRSFMSMINRDYTYEAINNAFCNAHNLIREEIIGKRLDVIWGEENFRKVIKPNIDKSFDNHEVHYQAWFDTPRYGRRCFEVAFYPFIDKEGIVTHIVVDTTDITEKKLTEIALKESEEKYRGLVELANDGIVILKEGRIVFTNPCVHKLTGYSAEDMMEREVTQFVHRDVLSTEKKRAETRSAGKVISPVYETILVAGNGSPVNVEVNEGIIWYEGGEANLLIIRNIAERKMAELRISQQAEDLILINELNEMANAGSNIQMIAGKLWDRTRDIFRSKGGAIYLLNEDRNKLVLQKNVHVNRIFGKVKKIAPVSAGDIVVTRKEGSRFWSVLENDRAFVSGSREEVCRLIAEHDLVGSFEKFLPGILEMVGIHQLALIPLIAASQPVGLLVIGRGEDFRDSDISRLEAFARQVTSILLKIEAVDRNRKQQEDLELINRLNQLVNQGEGVDIIFHHLYKETRKMFQGMGVSIYLYSETGNRLVPASLGIPPGMLRKIESLAGINLFETISIDLDTSVFYKKVLESGNAFQCRSRDEILEAGREFVADRKLRKFTPRVVDLLKLNAMLTIPLVSDRLLGILEIGREKEFSSLDSERLSGIARQVTSILSRKFEEDRRKDSETKYRSLFENANDAIVLFKNNVIVECNKRIRDIYGYTPAEIIGKTMMDLSPEVQPDGQNSEELENEFIRKAGQGMSQFFEWQQVHADGSLFWTEVSLNQVILKGKKFIQAIVKDITERKKAEEENMRLITAIEQTVEAVVITNTDGIILYVNPAFEKVTGYTREESLGNNPSILKSGQQPVDFYRNLWNTIKSGRVWEGEFVNRRKDGSFYQERAVISPITNDVGEIVNFVSVKRNVTHEKLLEAQLRQSQKLETVGTLAGGIAHDFNNILATIMGYADMAVKDISKSDPVYDDLQKILKAANRGKDLIRKILTFSRQLDVKLEPVDVLKTIQEGIDLIKPSLPVNIRIKKDLDECGQVYADQGQLQQVFMNLATNAAYAMKDKGGEIHIQLNTLRIGPENRSLFPAMQTGKYTHLRIRDTGIGMDKNTLSRIFEPFFTTKPVGEGTGLGLSVTHGIVKNIGGEIVVESEKDRGSTFHVLLPVMDAGPQASAEAPGDESGIFGTERLLFVDDEPELTGIAKRMLEKLGFSVTTATNPKKALKLFLADPSSFDLLITDQVMLQMTGDQLASEMLSVRPDLPVVLITGFKETLTPEKIQSIGIREYVFKPLTMTELGRTIRKVLDNK